LIASLDLLAILKERRKPEPAVCASTVDRSCFPCPEGVATSLIVALVSLTLVFLRALWYITMVKSEKMKGDKEQETGQNDFDDAAEVESTARTVQETIQVNRPRPYLLSLGPS
jgi:hypothetical protein